MSEDRLAEIDGAIAEIEDARMLDRDRRTADPARGVICSLRCSERRSVHTGFLVEAIIREEERS